MHVESQRSHFNYISKAHIDFHEELIDYCSHTILVIKIDFLVYLFLESQKEKEKKGHKIIYIYIIHIIIV